MERSSTMLVYAGRRSALSAGDHRLVQRNVYGGSEQSSTPRLDHVEH